jgi:hypothetical protein
MSARVHGGSAFSLGRTEMRLSYTMRFGHLWLFSVIHVLRSPLAHCIAALLAAYYAVSTPLRHNCHGFHCIGAGAFIFTGLYIMLLSAYVVLCTIAVLFQSKKTMLTEHSLELRDEGLYEETQYNKSLYLWASVHRTASTLGIVAVYVAPSVALVIPWSAFPSTEQRAAFIAAIKERARAA